MGFAQGYLSGLTDSTQCSKPVALSTFHVICFFKLKV